MGTKQPKAALKRFGMYVRENPHLISLLAYAFAPDKHETLPTEPFIGVRLKPHLEEFEAIKKENPLYEKFVERAAEMYCERWVGTDFASDFPFKSISSAYFTRN